MTAAFVHVALASYPGFTLTAPPGRGAPVGRGGQGFRTEGAAQAVRAVALGQLAEINRIALRNRILVMDVMANPAPTNVEKRTAEIVENRARADELQKAYLATKLTVEEERLAKEMVAARNKISRSSFVNSRLCLRGKNDIPL